MNRYLSLNKKRRYEPRAKHNIASWKNVLLTFWMQYKDDNRVMEYVLVNSVMNHPKGDQNFINYCVRESHLLEVK